MYSLFDADGEKFNRMYSLPINKHPTFLGVQRLKDFKKILLDEIEEVEEIIQLAETSPRDAMIALADWLGDIPVFCKTESIKWGIPLGPVVQAIMESNFTKLGLDGNPIIDATGKVLKGPNFAPPEPEIERILFGEHSYLGSKIIEGLEDARAQYERKSQDDAR